MVGMIVIMITLLIVSSIILSERVNVQGTVSEYRSAQIAGIATEVQTRLIEQVRTAILSSVEEDLPTTGIRVLDCPNPGLADEYYPDPGIDIKGIGPADESEYCAANSYDQLQRTMTNVLGKRLLESSVQAVIERITDKYSLIHARPLPVDFDLIKSDVEFIDCGYDRCDDGRLRATVDFTGLAETPVAEVLDTAGSKSLKVFLPPEKREYTTREPYGKYALLFSKLFSGFTILDSDWHMAGNTAHGTDPVTDLSRTSGGEWFHYAYAYSVRNVSSRAGQPLATQWVSGFNVSTRLAQNEDTGVDLFVTLSPNGPEALEDPPYPASEFPRDKLKISSLSSARLSDLEDFTAGFYTKSSAREAGGIDNIVVSQSKIPAGDSQPAYDKDVGGVLPAGCVSLNADGTCALQGIEGSSCLANDPEAKASAAFDKVEPYSGGEVVVDTTTLYDERFNGTGSDTMEDLVEDLARDVESSSVLKSSMGYSPGDRIIYNLTVESKQYYTPGPEHYGGTNYQCGYFVTEYQPGIAGIECADARARPELDVRFLSEPIPFACESQVLYRVDEIYRLYRNNNTNPNSPDQVVFAAEIIHYKRDFNKWKDTGDEDLSLPAYARGSLQDAGDTETERVRHCVYSYQTGAGQKFSQSCEWVSGRP
jgi:hypothetical protein